MSLFANAGALAPVASPALLRPSPGPHRKQPVLWRLACLEPGDLLRIDDGAGTTVHARSGRLWITEEGSREDIVLVPGSTHCIARHGVTLVEPCHAARAVIEVPQGVDGPARIVMTWLGREPQRATAPSERRSWFERLRQAARAVLFPHVDSLFAEPAARPSRRPGALPVPGDVLMPEAVRDRLLRASPGPL